MIGQTKLISQLCNLSNDGFPRFAILAGASGSGRKTIVKQVAKMLNARLIWVDTKVEAVREAITLAYKHDEPALYVIADADRMSSAAKNALLKITEEPPRRAYFIMTVQDTQQTLETLRSRALTLNMDCYSGDELIEYAMSVTDGVSREEDDIIREICSTPGEVNTLFRYSSIPKFYDYVQTVVENIGVVNGANAFKIGSSIAFKDGDEGYDASLFFRAVMSICASAMRQSTQDLKQYAESIRVTGKYLNELSLNGVNKSATFDMWILDMRQIWRPEIE